MSRALVRPRLEAGGLHGEPEHLQRLAAAGIESVADLIARSEAIRDLPDRSNHELVLDGWHLYIKRGKPKRRRSGDLRMPREAAGIVAVHALSLPTAELIAYGIDPEVGAVTATASLAPARFLDELLQANALTPATQRAVARRLAGYVGRLHDGGLHHRDLYLNHIAVAGDGTGLALIDWERVSRHARRLGRRVVKDLAALDSSARALVSDAERLRFLVAYLRARDIPRRGVIQGLGRRIVRKADRMLAHTPRTPVGDAARPESAGS